MKIFKVCSFVHVFLFALECQIDVDKWSRYNHLYAFPSDESTKQILCGKLGHSHHTRKPLCHYEVIHAKSPQKGWEKICHILSKQYLLCAA